ncbi:membrane protein insertion efficiency factor YidD [Blastochloris sulfoviridis]|uniref:membrane protein insertion efficiency factor YidD n=1 Tax=Blastochloris sulfoviridis TaxID=50712 RepID=UPI003CCC7137
MSRVIHLPALAARGLIRTYQLSFSMLAGRGCRHLPTCSSYMDEAIARHGLWAGGWMGFARLCRCTPLGTSGLDFVCERVPDKARWYVPWRYGLWRSTNPGPEPEGSLLEGIDLDRAAER